MTINTHLGGGDTCVPSSTNSYSSGQEAVDAWLGCVRSKYVGCETYVNYPSDVESVFAYLNFVGGCSTTDVWVEAKPRCPDGYTFSTTDPGQCVPFVFRLEIKPQTTRMKPSVRRAANCVHFGYEEQQSLKLACIHNDTGANVEFCNVTLKWHAKFGSGGHAHDSNRPPGQFSAGQRVGGSIGPGPAGFFEVYAPAGRATAIYTAPEASSDIEIVGTAYAHIYGRVVYAAPFKLSLEVTQEDLDRTDGAGLQIETASTMHNGHNGYATQATTVGLRTLAAEFSQALEDEGMSTDQIPPIRVTAISLPRGGLFDYATQWSPPHCGHRRGDQVDIGMRDFSPSHKKALQDALENSPFTTPVPAESPANPTASRRASSYLSPESCS